VLHNSAENIWTQETRKGQETGENCVMRSFTDNVGGRPHSIHECVKGCLSEISSSHKECLDINWRIILK
jgi:hypothetical protein